MKLLLALITGTLLLPSAASAETWWLIIAGRHGSSWGNGAVSVFLEKVPMETEEQCITAGDSIFNSKDVESPNNIHHDKSIPTIRYMCILGK